MINYSGWGGGRLGCIKQTRTQKCVKHITSCTSCKWGERGSFITLAYTDFVLVIVLMVQMIRFLLQFPDPECDVCASQSCQNRRSCENVIGSSPTYNCFCKYDYTGLACETSKRLTNWYRCMPSHQMSQTRQCQSNALQNYF